MEEVPRSWWWVERGYSPYLSCYIVPDGGTAHLATSPLQSLVKWESENKMVCEQRLLKGEGPKTSWTRELTNDEELILVSPASSQLSASPLLPRGMSWGAPGCRGFTDSHGWFPTSCWSCWGVSKLSLSTQCPHANEKWRPLGGEQWIFTERSQQLSRGPPPA